MGTVGGGNVEGGGRTGWELLEEGVWKGEGGQDGNCWRRECGRGREDRMGTVGGGSVDRMGTVGGGSVEGGGRTGWELLLLHSCNYLLLFIIVVPSSLISMQKSTIRKP